MTQGCLTINKARYSFETGQTNLQVAGKIRFPLPTLCYIKDALPTRLTAAWLID